MSIVFSISCLGEQGLSRCGNISRRSEGPGGAAAKTGAAALSTAGGRLAKAWDWVGIVGTGQSLSVGAEGVPIEAQGKPTHNLVLSLGRATVPPFDPTSSALSMAPLLEPIRPRATTYPSAYPANLYGETPHVAMADQISALFRQVSSDDYITVHTIVGESGQPMSVIDKSAIENVAGATSTGRAYTATLFEATAVARLARAAGRTYGIGAIVLTHGESDASNVAYEQALRRLRSDYSRDLAAITGQTTSIPMLVSQQQSVPSAIGTTSASTLAQWRVGLDRSGIVCSGPKYQYQYSPDGVHLTARGYEQLGEKYAEVYFRVVALGENWQPLQPTRAERAGNVLTIRFHVPVPPLAWDDSFAPPHRTGLFEWARGRGFEVRGGGAPVPITSVTIVGDSVRIVCGKDLSGGDVEVGYALTAVGTPSPGGTTRWGQLRDSDPVVGTTTGATQPNYCVTFSLPVP
ncbi:MAG TPA: dockerin [Polyangiaceae bacterium]|nr:dockerin [Polyangiaceae bacterium]